MYTIHTSLHPPPQVIFLHGNGFFLRLRLQCIYILSKCIFISKLSLRKKPSSSQFHHVKVSSYQVFFLSSRHIYLLATFMNIIYIYIHILYSNILVYPLYIYVPYFWYKMSKHNPGEFYYMNKRNLYEQSIQ